METSGQKGDAASHPKGGLGSEASPDPLSSAGPRLCPPPSQGAGAGAGSHLRAGGKPMPYSVTTAAPPRPRLCCSATFAPGTCLPPARPRSCQQSSAHCARPERWSTERVAAPPPSSRRGVAPEGSADRPGAAPTGLWGKVVFMGFTHTRTTQLGGLQCNAQVMHLTLRYQTSIPHRRVSSGLSVRRLKNNYQTQLSTDS